MSIKQRVREAEKKAGISSAVDIITFVTTYTNKDGSVGQQTYLSAVGKPGDSESYFCVNSSEGEAREDFFARVESECLAAFGELPRNWQGDRV
jgi:hypothetical protein